MASRFGRCLVIEPIERLREIGGILDRLGIVWVLGGSMASSVFGEARPTNDVDLAVRLELDDVNRLVEACRADYYIDEQMVRDSMRDSSSFNIIHFESGFKVDFFVNGTTLLDRRQMQLRERRPVEEFENLEVWIAPPSEQILRKLWWYRMGMEVSDRQWRDVMFMLMQQRDVVDRDELRRVGAEAGIGDLVIRALRQLDTDGSPEGTSRQNT